jgi:predicted CoA-binding protein
MASLQKIHEFLDAQPLAMVGVSRNPKKFGYVAFRELKDKGMKIVPVNPLSDEIMGDKCYRNIASLPPEIKGVIILTKKAQTATIVREAREKGIRQIWIQQMAESPDAIKELDGTDINCITRECILMHYKPNGMHKLHAGIRKFFGMFPK